MSFESEGYELKERIAGDMWGELFVAEYVSHGRSVLFRSFRDGMAVPGPWELAAAEIQAWARVDHPAVIQPLDWASTPTGAFLAMEMPRGELLRDCLRPDGAAALDDPEAAFVNLAKAVEAARSLGVLHLGLCDTCIWVCPDSTVMVSDFGLWYVTSEFPGLSDARPPCCAPEQRRSGEASAASDVYSLALLHLAMTRGLETAARAAAGDLSRAGTGEGCMAGRLSACLSEDPYARPGCAGELAGPAEGGKAAQPAYRDCPVCRLKEEIAHDFRLRKPTPVDRLRDLDADLFDTGVRDGLPGARTPRGSERSTPASPTVAKLFPWIALALAVMTVVVWWLAFRQ